MMRFIRRVFAGRRSPPSFIDYWVAGVTNAYAPEFPIVDRVAFTAPLPAVAAFWMTLGRMCRDRVVPLMRQGTTYEEQEIGQLLDPAPLEKAYPNPQELESLEVLSRRWVTPTLAWVGVERYGLAAVGDQSANALAERVLREGLTLGDLLRVFKELAVQGLRVGYAKPLVAQELAWDYIRLQERDARFVLDPAFGDVIPENMITTMQARARTLQDYEREVAATFSMYESAFGPVEAVGYGA